MAIPAAPEAPVTIIVFETHATSLDNEAGRASGWHDVDLSPTGERQAAELGARHAGTPPDIVYASDLLRAVRTATIAFGDRMPMVCDARLRECDYGALTLAPVSAIEAIRPAHMDQPFPAGESYADVARRVGAWLDDVRAREAGRLVLVIGHRATWYALEHLLAGRPLADTVAAPWQWQPGWRYTVP